MGGFNLLDPYLKSIYMDCFKVSTFGGLLVKLLAILLGVLGSLAMPATAYFIAILTTPYSTRLTGWLIYPALLGLLASVASIFESGSVLRGNAVAMILAGLPGMLLWLGLPGMWSWSHHSFYGWMAQIAGWSGPILLIVAGILTYRQGRADFRRSSNRQAASNRKG